MFQFIIPLAFLNTVIPYARKNLLLNLNAFEYNIIDNIIYFCVFFFIAILYFLYILWSNKPGTINNIVEGFQNLSITNICCFVIISVAIIISSYFIAELDKKYNTPTINSMYTRAASTVFLVIAGIFVFEEKYNWIQICGVILTLVGVFMIAEN
jgi:drug/metabolite transporter (DMT)-like permease